MEKDFTYCISCGMPLREKKDYPCGDESKNFCVHCGDEKGNLKSYDEVLKGMSGFFQKEQGVDEHTAQSIAKTVMAKMPAWKGL
ncbi:MAG: hypothetical protein JW769_01550 [Parachlamydiales bacterium]|nr:hypothetical protein [Parachlamydiales bacterium]